MPPLLIPLEQGIWILIEFRINLIDGRINLDDGTSIYINNGKFNAFDIKQRHGQDKYLLMPLQM